MFTSYFFSLLLCLQDADASKDASYGNIHMAGQDVFKFAVRSVPAVIDAALKQAQLSKEDVDWLVMHQANQRILDAAAQRLGLPAERVSNYK
jgi:3-oxoacyl-[acyl-carrier-protein] synthase-3